MTGLHLISKDGVKRYGYRTAQPAIPLFTVKFTAGDQIDRLRQELAGLVNARPDNHELYLLGASTVVAFSDWYMTVGEGVHERSW